MEWWEILELICKTGLPAALGGLVLKLWTEYKASREGDLCVLRQMMLEIYRRYEDEKAWPEYEAESFCKMHKVYKKRGGNSFVDNLKTITETWEIRV